MPFPRQNLPKANLLQGQFQRHHHKIRDHFTYGVSLGGEAQSIGGVAVGLNVGYTVSSNDDAFGRLMSRLTLTTPSKAQNVKRRPDKPRLSLDLRTCQADSIGLQLKL